MTFIGVDQVLQQTGVCVLADGRDPFLTLIDTADLRGPTRLCYIRDELQRIIDQAGGVTFGALENGSYNSVGRVYQLGGVNALVQCVFWDNHIGFANVAPAQLKKFQTRKAGAQKEWMVEAAEEFLGYKIDDDDNLADALGLARIARALHTEEVTNRAEAEVVHKLKTSDNYHVWTTNNDSG